MGTVAITEVSSVRGATTLFRLPEATRASRRKKNNTTGERDGKDLEALSLRCK